MFTDVRKVVHEPWQGVGCRLDLSRTRHQARAVTRKIKSGPTLGKAGAGAREARAERLAAALRENLRKRKAQARDRAEPEQPISPKSKQS
jgi:hypothetical protein